MKVAAQILDFTLRWRLSVCCAVLILTLPAIWVLSKAEISKSIIESFVDDPQDYVRAKRMEGLFSGNPDALIWMATTEGDSLFSNEKLLAIARAAKSIESLPSVRRVIAIPNLPLPLDAASGLRSTVGKIILSRQLRAGEVPSQTVINSSLLRMQRRLSADELKELRTLLEDPTTLGNRLLSRDGNSQVMLVELAAPDALSPVEQIKIIDDLRSVASLYGLGKDGLYLSGLIAIQAFAFEEILFVLKAILPLGGLLICLAVLFVFQRIEVILLTLFIASVSVTWGMALGIVAFGKISVLMAAVPLMVLVISTADVIHLVSSYTAERAGGRSHEDSLRRTYFEVGGACILTSLTTFVGFASLIFVPSQTVRQFGFGTACGVASALLLSVLLVPLFLEQLHRWQRPVLAAASASHLTKSLARVCLHVACKYPKAIITVFVAVFLVCVTLANRVVLDPDLAERFSAKHLLSESTRFFQDQYGGVNSIELLLRGTPEQLLSPEGLSRMRSFAERCQTRFGFETVDSIDKLIGNFLQKLDYRDANGLPESAKHSLAAIQYLRQFNPDVVNRLVTPDGGQARILIRVPATSYLELLNASQMLLTLARSHFGSTIEITEKGSAPIVGQAVQEIIRGHLQGFIFCFSSIFILIAAGLRSWKLASISALPNLTPLLILAGLIAILTPRADSDLLGVATLGLGLAVDDTIHFLSRFRLEQRAGLSCDRSLELAMEHTGVAIIRTTLILSAGFIPFAFSSYLSVNMLGSYLIAVLVAAVLADLILFPAIIRICYPD